MDIKTKETLAIEITNETVTDSEKFNDLINQTEQNIGSKEIERVLGDGGYDYKECFNTLDEKDIESGIKTRINASTRSRDRRIELNASGKEKDWVFCCEENIW